MTTRTNHALTEALERVLLRNVTFRNGVRADLGLPPVADTAATPSRVSGRRAATPTTQPAAVSSLATDSTRPHPRRQTCERG